MSISDIVYNLLIGPLELFFQIIFATANKFVSNPGYAIIALSLAMNILVLPLYRRADAVQAEERDREAKLKPWVDHIKKTFSGDERFMMTQALYRENNYKPTDSLKGSISLLLEIPFFIAAYHFLSNLEILRGVSFGPILDLGKPDALITIGSLTINVLPILMTLVNVISAAIYMKGFPLKSKIQMYGVAVIFLVFLYTSPAGLVFYWTLNNVFSLVKNIFYKIKEPQKVLSILLAIAGACGLIFVLLIHPMYSTKAQVFSILLLLLMFVPLISRLLKGKGKTINLESTDRPGPLFTLSQVLLIILTGLLIPSSVLKGSAAEFVSVTDYESPLWYVASTFTLAAGTFGVWFRIFYNLANNKWKGVIALLTTIMAFAGLANYMVFTNKFGNLSPQLLYDAFPAVGMQVIIINTGMLFAIGLLISLIYFKKIKLIRFITLVTCIAIALMAGININGINGEIKKNSDLVQAANAGTPRISLSKKGKNVIVLMMDRQIGSMVPYILNEKPDLKEQFEGFTYYSNSVSFGNFTNVGSPALFGGYDYTGENINKRDKEPLVKKHNEALKVMPEIFGKAGYDVTICDPTYAGYSWIPDLSIFKDHPEYKCYITKGKYPLNEFNYTPSSVAVTKSRFRNFFCYSLFRIVPSALQLRIYDEGNYNEPYASTEIPAQTIKDKSRFTGYKETFMASYGVLCNLPKITKIDRKKNNHFLMMSNDTTHEESLLKEPDYIPAPQGDNTEYDNAHPDRKDADGNVFALDTPNKMMHYHVNMATMLKLGEYMDYLRKEGVYDNTRIIIVSDHGRMLSEAQEDNNFNYHYTDSYGNDVAMDIRWFNCVLMVKDFNSKTFKTKDELVTNADTPALALSGIVEDPKNPFTGNPLKTLDETDVKLHLQFTHDWQTTENHGTVFTKSPWFSVKGNALDKTNWKYEGDH